MAPLVSPEDRGSGRFAECARTNMHRPRAPFKEAQPRSRPSLHRRGNRAFGGNIGK
jgi:hypothetical protein